MNNNYRFEFKYLVDPHTAEAVKQDLLRFGMKPDSPHCYKVASLYYDSPNLYDYHDKAGGFLNRKKFRFRVYHENFEGAGHGWLEIKRKQDAQNRKTRIFVPQNKIGKLLRSGVQSILELEGIDKQIKNEALSDYVRFAYRPNIIVRYDRQAFADHTKKARISFDSRLEACKWNYTCYNSPITAVRDEPIMEVKFNFALPFWFNRLIRKFDLKRTTCSKYELSLDATSKYLKPAK